MIGRYPDIAILVLFYRGDTIVSQSGFDGHSLDFLGFLVVAEQTVIGADIQLVTKFACDAYGCTIV